VFVPELMNSLKLHLYRLFTHPFAFWITDIFQPSSFQLRHLFMVVLLHLADGRIVFLVDSSDVASLLSPSGLRTDSMLTINVEIEDWSLGLQL
jgi:hypothetical protein